MKYTTNYNLYKPDYDDTIDVDFLNKNMDVLDNQLNGLNYVQNVNISDDRLKFIKRNGDVATWKNAYIVERGDNYIKYSDGTAVIFDRTNVTQYDGTYTLPIPLVGITTAVATYTNFSDSWVANIEHVVHEISTTYLNIQVRVVTGALDGNVITTGYIHIIGSWK